MFRHPADKAENVEWESMGNGKSDRFTIINRFRITAQIQKNEFAIKNIKTYK